jgi:hypothetical protein
MFTVRCVGHRLPVPKAAISLSELARERSQGCGAYRWRHQTTARAAGEQSLHPSRPKVSLDLYNYGLLSYILLTRMLRKHSESLISGTATSTNTDTAEFRRARRTNHRLVPVRPPTHLATLQTAQATLHESGIVNEEVSLNERFSAEERLDEVIPHSVYLRTLEPLLDLEQDTAVHWFDVFTDTVIPSFPCVDVNGLREELGYVFSSASPPRTHHTRSEILKLDILKAAIAIALANEDELPTSTLATDLESHLSWTPDESIRGPVTTLEHITIPALMVCHRCVDGENIHLHSNSVFTILSMMSENLLGELSASRYEAV